MADDLILVNERNRAIGRAAKFEVHQTGLLHRAFSVFLVDPAGQSLLQQRHPAKYHSGGLWANSCCGHPRPGESTIGAARRRVQEELGAAARVKFSFFTRYATTFPNGLIENEIVYVYFGMLPAPLRPNPSEVSGLALRTLATLKDDIEKSPEAYAFWLKYYLAHHSRQISDSIDLLLQSAPDRQVLLCRDGGS